MRKLLATISAVLASLVAIAPAQGATDPLFVYTPLPPSKPPIVPPPTGSFNGPCGIGVDGVGRFYVSDHNHDVVDVYSSTPGYITQLGGASIAHGPCGLAFNSFNQPYVNNYHHDVVQFNAYPSFGSGSALPLPAEDTAHHLPAGVAVNSDTGSVYVNHRTYVSVFDSAGNPVLDAGVPLKIGDGSLLDGYGVAVSQFPGTYGRLYVPDAGTNTVKVYDPAASKTTPVAEIKDPLNKPFTSLRDSAIALDETTGVVYFADNRQPGSTEQPQATIYLYTASNAYAGHLKYNVIDALPPGLAVDNSGGGTQGRVYVTSGNTSPASIYAYGPGSGTFANPLPPIGSGLQAPGSSNGTQTDPGSGDLLSRESAAPRSDDPASAGASVINQSENLRVSVKGRFSPRRLPRKGLAPISVSVGWDISTTDGSAPPRLKELRIEINRHGHFESRGLSACPLSNIQPATTQRALSNCGSALVGRGSFSAEIAPNGQKGGAYESRGKLLVFNGELKGKRVLFGQIYTPRPATSFVIPFEVEDLGRGSYGTALTATLPKSLRSWGNLTAIEMRLSRRYAFAGKSRSYISSGCPAPKGLGRASFKLVRTALTFSDGKQLSGTVLGDCRVRG